MKLYIKWSAVNYGTPFMPILNEYTDFTCSLLFLQRTCGTHRD